MGDQHRRPGGWKRWFWAIPASILLHFVFLALINQPRRYSPWKPILPVSVVQIPSRPLQSSPTAEASPKPGEDQPAPPEPKPEKKRRPRPKPALPPAETILRKENPKTDAGTEAKNRPILGDASVPDGGPVASRSLDASTGDAGARVAGIPGREIDAGPNCEPDLLALSPTDARWILWMRWGPIRTSPLALAVKRVLRSYPPFRKIAGEGENAIDPLSDLEILSVAAAHPLDWKSFFVLADSAIPIDILQKRIEGAAGQGASLRWRSDKDQTWGQRFFGPGREREPLLWHLGFGRILRVSPFETSPASEPVITASPPPLSHPLCLAATNAASPPLDNLTRPVELAQALILFAPPTDPPAAVIATDDLTTVGLARNSGDDASPRLVGARAFMLSNPRLELLALFDSEKAALRAQAIWQRNAVKLSKDPWLVLGGISTLFSSARFETRGRNVFVLLPMNRVQMEAALLFLELQGMALERRQLK